MTKRIFYRVEDESSQTRVRRNGDLIAADHLSIVKFDARRGRPLMELRSYLLEHLDWSSEEESPFISTYRDFSTAEREASRRDEQGKENVRIIKIDAERVNGRVQYRNVRKLAQRLACWIPNKAYHNSENEFIFLHRIPARAIVWRIPFPAVVGS